MQKAGRRFLLFGFLCFSCAMLATTLLQMNLEELTGNADKVFRGRVLAIDSGHVAAGGGQLSTITYKILVEETFKGEFEEIKDRKVAEVTMISGKRTGQSGNIQRLSPLAHMPKLEIGQTYLLFTTRPSAIGLSTTVGLGQGAFHIGGKPGAEIAVNEYNNVGLFRGMDAPTSMQAESTARRAAPATSSGTGPIPYADLAAQIRSLTGGK